MYAVEKLPITVVILKNPRYCCITDRNTIIDYSHVKSKAEALSKSSISLKYVGRDSICMKQMMSILLHWKQFLAEKANSSVDLTSLTL